MGRILIFQHDERCAPGRLGTVLAEHGRNVEIVRPDIDGVGAVPRDLHDVRGVVSLGGPMNVSDGLDWLNAEIGFLRSAHEAGIPTVGICLGHQAIAKALGGQVTPMERPEVGFFDIDLAHPAQNDPVFGGVQWRSTQSCSHGQEVSALPEGGVCLASSDACKVQAFRVGYTTYAFQYHLEWTRAQIADEAQEMLKGARMKRADLDGQIATHYERFDQIATRQCQNLVHLVLR